MEFRVLGPLEVLRVDGEPVDLGGPRQRIVLAMLLLESPRTVSVDRLVDAVWLNAPPATARSQIQICVYKLRQCLGLDGDPGTITTRRPGYLIDPGDAEFDRRSFDRDVVAARAHVAENRDAEAADRFVRALERWRGAALGGVDSLAVREVATHLEEERARVLEEYAEIELRRGRHRDLVAVLTREIDSYPLREQLRGQLMRALYGAGRQADALREFRRARRISIDELGIEPAEPLRLLEQAILNEDGSLVAGGEERAAPAVQVPRMLPAAVADFRGRTGAISLVREQLADRHADAGGGPGIVVLTGQGGNGKSALALHLTHLLAGHYPDGQLYASMHGATHPVPPAEVIARFLRALGVPGPAIPESLDERAELYRSRLAGRAVVVVLDDVALETQVLPLLPPGGASAVLITSRRRITALPGAVRIELGTFSVESAVELLTVVVGAERVDGDPEGAAELVKLCGYLPLAVRIAAARLAARPHWSLRTMVDRLSDESAQLDELRHGGMAVRASLLLTYEALEPEARRLLRMLALVDTPYFGSWACPVLLQVEPRRAEDQLDELVELHLVDADVDGDPLGARYRIHDLVRLFARERAVLEDPPGVRSAAIERFLAAMLGLAEEAHRLEYGGDFLIVHGTAPRHPVAESIRTVLMRHPLDWLARERQAIVAAVAQAAAVGLGALSWDLAISAVVLFEAHSLFDDWHATHEIGLAAARRDQDRLGEATMIYSLGSLHLFEHRFAEAGSLLATALEAFTALGHDQGIAMVVRNQAFIDRMTARYAQAVEGNERALEVFRRTGDRAGEAYVLSNLAQIDLDVGSDADALARLDAAVTICATIPDRRVGAQVAHRLGEVRLRQGDGGRAAASFRTVLEFAHGAGDRTAEAYALLGLGEAAILCGDLDAARTATCTARGLADELGERRLHLRALLLLSRAALRELDLPGARRLAQDALAAATPLGQPLLTATCLAALGDIDAAAGARDRAEHWWAGAQEHLGSVVPGFSGRFAAELAAKLGTADRPWSGAAV